MYKSIVHMRTHGLCWKSRYFPNSVHRSQLTVVIHFSILSYPHVPLSYTLAFIHPVMLYSNNINTDCMGRDNSCWLWYGHLYLRTVTPEGRVNF